MCILILLLHIIMLWDRTLYSSTVGYNPTTIRYKQLTCVDLYIAQLYQTCLLRVFLESGLKRKQANA